MRGGRFWLVALASAAVIALGLQAPAALASTRVGAAVTGGVAADDNPEPVVPGGTFPPRTEVDSNDQSIPVPPDPVVPPAGDTSVTVPSDGSYYYSPDHYQTFTTWSP
jgi:hypothetical protein